MSRLTSNFLKAVGAPAIALSASVALADPENYGVQVNGDNSPSIEQTIPQDIQRDMSSGDFSSLNSYRQDIGYDTPLLFDGSIIIEDNATSQEIDLTGITFDRISVLGTFSDTLQVLGGEATDKLYVDATNVSFIATSAGSVQFGDSSNIHFDRLAADEVNLRSGDTIGLIDSEIGNLKLLLAKTENFSFINSTANTIDASRAVLSNADFSGSSAHIMWSLNTEYLETNFTDFSATKSMFMETTLDELSSTSNPIIAEQVYNANTEIVNGEVLVALDDGITPDTLISGLLAKNAGIFIGDRHDSLEIRDYMSDSMPVFKDAGVDTLYIEFINSYEQDMIDDYITDQPGAREALFEYFTEHWYGEEAGGKGILSVLDAAKENNIRVIGVDNRSFDSNNDYPDHLFFNVAIQTHRNEEWSATILSDREQFGDAGKYLLWGGSRHGDGRLDAQGVDTTLGIPEVRMETLKDITSTMITESPDPSADYVISFAPPMD